MCIPDFFMVGSEGLPGLSFGWSATQAYSRAWCSHFCSPLVCFDYLEWVLGAPEMGLIASHNRNPPRNALRLSPARHLGGNFFSSFTLPPPSTTSSGSRAATKRATTSWTRRRHFFFPFFSSARLPT